MLLVRAALNRPYTFVILALLILIRSPVISSSILCPWTGYRTETNRSNSWPRASMRNAEWPCHVSFIGIPRGPATLSLPSDLHRFELRLRRQPGLQTLTPEELQEMQRLNPKKQG
jgi:hypothetical protein